MSYIAASTDLDLFNPTPEEGATAERRSDIITTTTPLPCSDVNTPLDFRITAAGEWFTDLSPTMLEIAVKVQYDEVEEKDKAIPDTAEGIMINNTLMSMFSGVEVSINDTVVVQNNNALPWAAYLDAMTGYTEDVRKSWLQASGYEDDEEGDSLTEKATARFKPFFKNGVKRYIGPVEIGFFKISKHIVPGVDITVRLFRQKPEFLLLYKRATGEKERSFKVILEKAYLHVHRVKLQDQAKKVIDRQREKTPAIYEFCDTVVRSIIVPSDTISVDTIVHDGPLPNRVDIVQVRQNAANGSLTENPLVLHHNSLRTISLEKNGQPVKAPYKCNFSEGDYMRPYMDFFVSRGCAGTSAMPFKDYKHKAIISYNLDRFAESDTNLKSSNERGNLRIKADYDQEKRNLGTFLMLCLMRFKRILAIDARGQVLMKFD